MIQVLTAFWGGSCSSAGGLTLVLSTATGNASKQAHRARIKQQCDGLHIYEQEHHNWNFSFGKLILIIY